LNGEDRTSGVPPGAVVQPPAQIDPKEIASNVSPIPTRHEDPLAIGDAAEMPSQASDLPDNSAVGIQRFKILDTHLAGGSFPDQDGIAWLHEKGYRTIIDLRDSREVDQAEIDAIARHGLRHVRIPIQPKAIDPELVSQFETSLQEEASRPIFFCDADGNRSGLLWYLHRTIVDQLAADIASREAEQIGLTDSRLYFYASEYLKRVKNVVVPLDETGSVKAPRTSLWDDGSGDLVAGDQCADVQSCEPPTLADQQTGFESTRTDSTDDSMFLAWRRLTAPMAALVCIPLR
jgi:protein tyrosine phosphatase (PTP) superfamily phosphohydrolase (DUF442 family)